MEKSPLETRGFSFLGFKWNRRSLRSGRDDKGNGSVLVKIDYKMGAVSFRKGPLQSLLVYLECPD